MEIPIGWVRIYLKDSREPGFKGSSEIPPEPLTPRTLELL
jgi:hypothetical protein